MKADNFLNRSSRAQAMVEFALTLTILLMVIYGLLETGRLLFIYASTVTAARQAVRYGSATGDNGSGTLYYQDCTGIRAAAQSVGFINRFEDQDIQIAYDEGVNPDGTINQFDGHTDPDCENDLAGLEIDNGDRIRVQVATEWEPIVPIVPFSAFTIRAESARTILVSIAIQVTAVPEGWSGTGSGELSLDVAASTSTYDTLGQTISYTYTITNTGSAAVSGTFILTDSPVASNNCSAAAPASLAAGASFTCTGTYSITQPDLDTGFLTDVAQVTAPLFSNQDGVTITANQLPQLQLVKDGTPGASSIPGTTINYTYTVTNSGNVTLRAPYGVTDDKTNDEACPQTPDTLTPGASITCTSSTTITNNDVNAGVLVNQATATALFGFTTITSNVASYTVYTPPIFLTISVSAPSVTQAGQVITYTYHLYNNTAFSMSAPFQVTDSKVSDINCAGAPSSLAPGATTTCTGTYTVTQAEIDAGALISNTATARATATTTKMASFSEKGVKYSGSNEASASIFVTQTPALTLQVSATPSLAIVLGTVITHTYTLTNSGNVTLTPSFTVTDDRLADVSCADPSTVMAPGATKTCTGTYTIVQTDLDNGSVVSVATASAGFGTQVVVSTPVSTTIYTYEGNRLKLEKTANFAAVTGVGQIITYTYALHNTGNSELTSLAILDDKVPGVDCSLATSPLQPGKKTTCTGSYFTTQDDVNAGSVTNQANATALHQSETVISNTAIVTVVVNTP